MEATRVPAAMNKAIGGRTKTKASGSNSKSATAHRPGASGVLATLDG